MTIENRNFKKQLQSIRGLDPTAFQNNQEIQSCKVGSFLEMNSLTYKVEKLNKYLDVKWSDFAKRKKDYWVYELTLFCLETAEYKFIEWEVDDDLEVFETTKSVKHNQIQYNNSKLTKAMLEYISDEEEGTLILNGKKYHYSEDDTWAALFFYGEDDPIQVRFYEFEADDGESLTVEAWNDDGDIEREAFLSKSVNLSNINILNV